MDNWHIALVVAIAILAITSLVLHRRGSKWAALADAGIAGLQALETGHPALDVAVDVAKSNAVHDLFTGLLNER